MTVPAIDTNRLYTEAEFENLPEFGGQYELEDGRIVEKSMAGDEHFRIILVLILALSRFDPENRLGMFWSQTNINFGKGWIPAPDFAFMTASHVPAISSSSVKGVPDFVVEVHSPSDLDSKPGRDAAQNKIKRYQSYGVKLIWAINPRQQTVEIYHSNLPNPISVKGMGDTLEFETLIPGLNLPVASLFQK